MADLFKLLLTNWNCYSKEIQTEMINKYSGRRERRKFNGRLPHISELEVFKNY